MAQDFDVFLSHNSKDKPIVEEIGRRLKDRDLRVWFDMWELRPGSPWQDGLEEGIKSSGAVVVFIGNAGLGPWQEPEMRAFIDRSRREKLQVIPVLLPGAPREPQLPMFLGAFTWVDLRKGIDEDGMARLIWGITDIRPDASAKRFEGTLPLPAIHNLPFDSLGSFFKGRDTFLDQLRTDLAADPATALTQKQALSGLGGIGKTRLAVEYAWRNAPRYSAILFVRARSPEDLSRDLTLLAGPRVLNLELETASEDEVLGAVLRWLQQHPGWLLIFDNVDTTEAARAVRDLLPRLTAGHVVLTSRLSRWPREIRKHSLDMLEHDVALRYLLERTAGERRSQEDEQVSAGELADLLDGFPLALEQAASYIAVRGLSFKEYLEAWKNERAAVLEWYDEAETEYPCSMAVTWQHTFDQLGPGPRVLLRLLSHLAADPIPVDLLKEEEPMREAAELFSTEVKEKETVDIDADRDVAELVRYSLVFRDGEEISIHRMVQEVVRERIPDERRRDWIQKAVQLLWRYGPREPQDVRTWPIWDLLRPHASRVIDLAERAGIETPTSDLMSQLGILLHAKSLNGQAEPLMRRALEIVEESFGEEYPRGGILLNNLAALLMDTNRLSEAELLMRRALEIDERVFGEENPNVARDLHNLAWLLRATNRLAEAEPLMRQALEIDTKTFGEEHPNVAIHLNSLAALLLDANRSSEARSLIQRALGIDEKFFGKEHPNVAMNLNNLACSLMATNRLSEAEPLARRALEIGKRNFGEEHPVVANYINTLVELLFSTGRSLEAEPLMRRALEIDRKFYGEEHSKVAKDLNNLAQLLQATNRLSEAEPLMRYALEIDERSFGEGHPNVAIDLSNLAQLLQATNRLSEAELLMRRALEICEASLVEGHPWTETVRQNLEALMQALEEEDKKE